MFRLVFVHLISLLLLCFALLSFICFTSSADCLVWFVLSVVLCFVVCINLIRSAFKVGVQRHFMQSISDFVIKR